ncbi:hypothetical protein [Streptomyces yangpuensis]|uniref:hypothetical protein n=1 Tax=Streptomyces yangpuensis TaxID=1648182 RepID=UPI0037F78C10
MTGVRLMNRVRTCDHTNMSTPGMPLQAALIPDCTKPDAHHAAYRSAKASDAIFVCIARQGRRWKVQLDAMTSSKPIVPEQAMTVLRSAAEALVLAGTVTNADVGADYISMWPIESEEKARQIAAAFHAALYGLQQLHVAVPSQRGTA